MRCINHLDTDAVGICQQCGRAVCQTCVVIFGGKLYCTNCVQLKSEPASNKQVVAPIAPQPTGRLSPNLFTIGTVGCILLLVVFFLVNLFFLFAIFSYSLWDWAYVFFDVILFIISFPVILIAIGLYGFYRNLGMKGGKTSAIIIIFLSIFLCVLALLTLPTLLSTKYYYSPLMLIIYFGLYPILGVIFIIIGVTLNKARRYLTNIKKSGKFATILFVITGIICMIPSFNVVFSGVIGVFASVIGAFVFRKATLFTKGLIPQIQVPQYPIPASVTVQRSNTCVALSSELQPGIMPVPGTQIVYRCEKCGGAYIEGGTCPFCK